MPHPAGHPLKAVPIAVAEEEGSESDEDELKPRGTKCAFRDFSFVYRPNSKTSLKGSRKGFKHVLNCSVCFFLELEAIIV